MAEISKLWVPSRAQVRGEWIESGGTGSETNRFHSAAAFDRWLAEEHDDAWGGGYQHAREEVKREIDNLNLRINNVLKWCYSHDNPDAVPGSFEELMLTEAARVANILKGTRTHE